ncbi:hypothetical protein NPIL_362871 [Nephila pilipes]|uniref:Uncharacterized protein n=1 Tax=Nephila pilipes TaxID=299642 RepID=A0A8X6P2B5_NEPPI|nr:hypothetical protein NPIL_362871 [Nephila pilipes]
MEQKKGGENQSSHYLESEVSFLLLTGFNHPIDRILSRDGLVMTQPEADPNPPGKGSGGNLCPGNADVVISDTPGEGCFSPRIRLFSRTKAEKGGSPITQAKLWTVEDAN